MGCRSPQTRNKHASCACKQASTTCKQVVIMQVTHKLAVLAIVVVLSAVVVDAVVVIFLFLLGLVTANESARTTSRRASDHAHARSTHSLAQNI
jgi:hypothetical protein